jgi:hypothetical protein
MSYAFLIASVLTLALAFYMSNRYAGFVIAYVLLMVYILIERNKK